MALGTRHLWMNLWSRLNGQGNGTWVYNELLKAYTAADRSYHGIAHIKDCLLELQEVRHLALEPDSVEFALWYHDVVYDSTKSDNELRSADEAMKAITKYHFSFSMTQRQAIRKLIMATKHTIPQQTDDEKLIVDIDLSILGAGPDRFSNYEKGIRREYDHVPQEIFSARRAEILQSFLDRHRIYYTDFFMVKYEDRARKNLKLSIEQLQAATI